MEHYETSLQHVLAELERIDILIRLAVQRAREGQKNDDPYEGLYVSDREAEALAATPVGLPRWASLPPSQAEIDARRNLSMLSDQIALRKAASITWGVRLRLHELEGLFGLSPFDVDALLIGLAPEVDLRYERLWGYLHDDVTRKRPSVDLVLNLLCPSFTAKLELRSRFAPTAPLLRYRLIELFEDPARPKSPLLGMHLKVNNRIAAFLLGSDDIDAAIAPYVRRVMPGADAERPVAPGWVWERLDRMASAYAAGESLLVHMHGPQGIGKKAWAQVLTARVGLGLLIVDGEQLLASKELGVETTARLLVREAWLQGAALYWNGWELMLSNEKRPLQEALMRDLGERRGLTFTAGTLLWEPPEGTAFSFFSLELPRPTHAERVQIWTRSLGADIPAATAGELYAVANKFRFTAGKIRAAAAGAQNVARSTRADPTALDPQDLYAGCRAQSHINLGGLAKKITSEDTWRDIVLPTEPMRQLRELCDCVRYRAVVFEGWGFEHKLSHGKGLCTLFTGPSGTGKTMAAGIIAAELGLELYKIDLSGVVSKYIGETEKNLSRIFTEAETSHSILFFDEADALFGKRSEVKDAHDRYANIETSYLLQRMEEYEGISILATNLRRNLDEAFLRRMAFVVAFPFPEEEDRLRIWNSVWPSATPRRDDLDFAFMARQFKIAGGNIKNIAVGAAFLAAGGGTAVSMDQLIRSTQRELAKMGKACVASEFGPYARLLSGDPIHGAGSAR